MRLINLLPKEKQREFGYRKLLNIVIALIWLTAMSFVLVLFLQFGTKAYLQGQKAHLTRQIEELKAFASQEENTKIRTQIKQLNNLITDYQTLSSHIPKLSKVVRAFAPLVPAGVNITSMRIDAARRVVNINGHAPTRELVIKLYDNLVLANKDFPNVDYPLENVARPADIDFHFTFNISDELLK